MGQTPSSDMDEHGRRRPVSLPECRSCLSQLMVAWLAKKHKKKKNRTEKEKNGAKKNVND